MKKVEVVLGERPQDLKNCAVVISRYGYKIYLEKEVPLVGLGRLKRVVKTV